VVADFGHGVGGAGNFPTLEVLGADGELEGFGGGGGALGEVVGAFLGVVHFIGYGFVVDGDLVWVFGVCGIDELHCAGKFVGHGESVRGVCSRAEMVCRRISVRCKEIGNEVAQVGRR